MSTETIGTTPQPAPAPTWQAGLQLAMNATWKAIGIPTTAQPFHAGQTSWGRTGDYVGDVHYLLLAPLREIAAAYDVPVTETRPAGGGTTYTVVVPVDGVDVHIWTTNPADAPTTTSAVAE
ncbi:hypothetical protein ACIQRW_28860 [Streptomyces sp. NPDC091287]|uniref:hypothetical protein n=1 Tax=Streptomyces sp. NPDC091287 TaxID=3365988 RepID=UPI0038241E7F